MSLFQCLQLNYDEPLSCFAFNFKLSRPSNGGDHPEGSLEALESTLRAAAKGGGFLETCVGVAWGEEAEEEGIAREALAAMAVGAGQLSTSSIHVPSYFIGLYAAVWLQSLSIILPGACTHNAPPYECVRSRRKVRPLHPRPASQLNLSRLSQKPLE